MPLEIPGYYYDPEKGKYFKIEKSHTAPGGAAWSSDAVKRRKTEEVAEQAVQRRRRELRRHIARHALREDVLLGGMLRREVDGMGPFGAGDVRAAGWAGGVVRKGAVRFGQGQGANLPCLWVGGTEEMGVAYTTLDEESLLGSYIQADADGRIRLDGGTHAEPVRCPQMSSIQYHGPSHKVLLTSREPDHTCGLYLFSPPLEGGEHWLLGEANFYQRLSMRHRHRSEWVVHNSTPAPASSDLVCLMATNAGVVRVLENETMSLVSSPKNNPKEMFDMDFQQGNHNVVLAGGRASRLWMADLRSPKWSFIRHASSIARVRSVNEHQVVACGLQSSMCLYDLRFVSQRPNGMGPLVSFTGYRNEAHVHVGFDVCTEAGVVAAAQEDGTVGLFSLESGRRVRCEAMGFGRGRVVRALMFGEGGASLWIGEGPGIAKYAFGETSGW